LDWGGGLDGLRRGWAKLARDVDNVFLLCFNFFIPCENKRYFYNTSVFFFFQIGIVADVAIIHWTTKANLPTKQEINKK
jgi:hypothetical protein